MKPEEYPSETFCKNTNIVTGVLENFERMNTRSGSLKVILMSVFFFFFFFFFSKVFPNHLSEKMVSFLPKDVLSNPPQLITLKVESSQ